MSSQSTDSTKRTLFEKLLGALSKKHEHAVVTQNDRDFLQAQSALDDFNALVKQEPDIVLQLDYKPVVQEYERRFASLRQQRTKRKAGEWEALLESVEDDKAIFRSESLKAALSKRILSKGLWNDLAEEWKLRPPPDLLLKIMRDASANSGRSSVKNNKREQVRVLRDQYRQMLLRAVNPRHADSIEGVEFNPRPTSWTPGVELTKINRNPKVLTVQAKSQGGVYGQKPVLAVKRYAYNAPDTEASSQKAPHSSGSLREKVEREIAIMKLLSQECDRHVVQFVASWVEDTSGDIFMEYLEGGDLQTLIELAGFVDEGAMKPILRQILSGLQFIHGRNIVHRDIKTANIFLGIGGCVKIGDFGSAKYISEDKKFTKDKDIEQELAPSGTSIWMSPELARLETLKGKQAFKTDVWSFGCVIVSLLSGKEPWATSDLAKSSDQAGFYEIIRKELASMGTAKNNVIRGPPLPRVTRECRALMDRIFVKADKRISVDELLSHPWLKVEAGLRIPSSIVARR